MNKLSFTICSNNYLAQAITLCKSLKEHAPDYNICIVLCDTPKQELLKDIPQFINIIPVFALKIDLLPSMTKRYDIVELNTSIKASAFKFFYEKMSADQVFYFDPDILLVNNIKFIEDELVGHNILLTPHVLTPPPSDGYTPQENVFALHGLYNLGFLGTCRSDETIKMLNWWETRLVYNCYNRPTAGVFVDQLPMDLIPIYFEGVKISYNFGFNVAPWNFHERKISFKNNIFYVNDNVPLVFYHFTKVLNVLQNRRVRPMNSYTRFTFKNNVDLKTLYELYVEKIIANNYAVYMQHSPQLLGKIF